MPFLPTPRSFYFTSVYYFISVYYSYLHLLQFCLVLYKKLSIKKCPISSAPGPLELLSHCRCARLNVFPGIASSERCESSPVCIVLSIRPITMLVRTGRSETV